MSSHRHRNNHDDRQRRIDTMLSSSNSRPPRNNTTRRNMNLANVGKETRAALPGILKDLPHIHADESEVWSFDMLPLLNASDCPKYAKKAVVKVINEDTFNAAISLAALSKAHNPADRRARVSVLNFASDLRPGGGWLKGSLAQEEVLCYRSSLSLSLHKRYYPIAERQALYAPDVVIVRSDIDSGHALLTPAIHPADLPVVSVVSIAAIRKPERREVMVTGSNGPKKKFLFAKTEDRELTKAKMRLTLRISATQGHSLLVLGALGCGAFSGPVQDIAACWVEVLKENEFSGGWWKEIWFAVYDPGKKDGNFAEFESVLEGLEV